MSSDLINIAGTLVSASAERKAAIASAKADEENARLTELSGEIENEQVRRDARAADGEAIVAAASNGGAISGQSVADMLAQSSVEREYAVLANRYSASTQAHDLRLQGRAKRKAGHAAMVGGVIRAGAQAMKMVEDAAKAGAGAPTGGTPLPTPKGP